MARLTAGKTRNHRNGHVLTRNWDARADTYYRGELVMIDSGGFAADAAVAASNKGCVGIVLEDTVIATEGDPLPVQYSPDGEFHFDDCTALAQGDVGSLLYANDTGDHQATGDATTNAPAVGTIVKFVSATECWAKVTGMPPADLAAVAP